MSNRVAFTNLDIDVMKAKLQQLDDISERITTLGKLLEDNLLYNIKPGDFYVISSSVSDAYSSLNGMPLTGEALASSMVNARLEKGGKLSKIKTDFNNNATTIIKRIKSLRDSIEFANRNRVDGEDEGNIRLTTTVDNGGVVPVTAGGGEPTGGSGGRVSNNKYRVNKEVTLTLPDGKKVVLSQGEHDIIDRKYDANGNLEAVAIEVDGQKVWIYFGKKGNIEKYVIETKGVMYNVTSTLSFTNLDGTTTVIPAGSYEVVEAIYNAYGQLVQIALIVNGKRIDVEVKDGQIVGLASVLKQEFEVKETIVIKLPNGKTLTIKAGKYKVVDVIYNADGTIQSVCIEVNGYQVWFELDRSGAVVKVIVVMKGETYKLDVSVEYTDKDGKKKTIVPGIYKIVEVVYAPDGTLLQIIILVDGKKIALDIKGGKVVGASLVEERYYDLTQTITLTLPNGKQITIKPGKYRIVEVNYNSDGSIQSICIEANGYKVWLEFDKNGAIVKVIVVMNGETYKLDVSVEYTDSNGNKIVITPGTYKIIEVVYGPDGTLLQIIILVNGQKIALDIKNGSVVGAVEVDTYYYNMKETITVKLPNGTTITIKPGKYKIVDVKYDENGNLIEVCIEVDGHLVWLIFDENGKIIQVKVIINNGKFTLDADFEYVDANGNVIKIERGVYTLLEAIYDENGNLIQVVILVDGKRITINIKDGKVLGIADVTPATFEITSTIYAYASDGTIVKITPGVYPIIKYLYDKDGNIIGIVIRVGDKIVTLRYFNGRVVGITVEPTTYKLKEAVTITLPDGTQMTIPVGEYQIIDVIYDEHGNVIAVCVMYKGYKLWFYLDSYGNVTRVEVIKITPGVFKITSPDLVVKDKYGNILSSVEPGEYYVYEVRYDQDGNIIAVRISPDGEDEVWVYLNPDSENDELSLFGDNVEGNGGILAFFEDKSKLLGVLGVFFVTAGAIVALKKRKKKKNEDADDEEWEDGGTLDSGNYAVYEVEEDKEKNVTAARITPDDAEEEYWVEM